MITKVLLLIARWSFGAKIIEILAVAHSKTVGHRTEILIGIEALIEAAKLLGLLDASIADPIKVALLGAIGPTLAEKIGRIQDQAEAVVPSKQP